MSLTFKPLKPCISQGLKPVWVLISIFSDNSFLALCISIRHLSSVGGWMLRSSAM